jgi:hypothetical protein
MYRNFVKNTTLALGTLLVGSTLVMAAGMPGAVTALDGKGMATVRTSDGKDHQVKAGEGWKVGAKVECETKNTALECRSAQAQSAATTPAPKPAPSTPAPSSPTPGATTTTPAPASR